jgi:pSer/pThr/pTyr-binding forkhead associated (FHA) protein
MRFLLRRKGRDIVLPEHSITVGSGSVCDIVLDDPRISAEHARLVATIHGVRVTDLDSRNGVVVNGVRVTRATSLVVGDLLAFGDVVFEVAAEEEQGGDSHDGDRPTLMDVVSPFAHGAVEHSQDIEEGLLGFGPG